MGDDRAVNPALGVKVHGLREVTAAFREMDRKLAKQFSDDLKGAADPLVEDIREREKRKFRGASIETIKARRSGPKVFVAQTAKKVTGKRSDFGRAQMLDAFIPGREAKEDEVFDLVERVLDLYSHESGLGGI